jgi:twin arginine-targeting protein translocase, TatA/E family
MNLVIAGMVSPINIIVIVVLVVLLFGGKKIPELMKGLGKGIKEFKKATNELDDDDEPKKEQEKLS